jgi:hypothetical protein
MKMGNYGKTCENQKTKMAGKRAGKYGNEEGTRWYGMGMKEGRERAGGEIFSVPAHILSPYNLVQDLTI